MLWSRTQKQGQKLEGGRRSRCPFVRVSSHLVEDVHRRQLLDREEEHRAARGDRPVPLARRVDLPRGLLRRLQLPRDQLGRGLGAVEVRDQRLVVEDVPAAPMTKTTRGVLGPF